MEYINNIRKAKPSAWGVREYNAHDKEENESYFDYDKKHYGEFNEVFSDKSDMYYESEYVNPNLDRKCGQEFELFEREEIHAKIDELVKKVEDNSNTFDSLMTAVFISCFADELKELF